MIEDRGPLDLTLQIEKLTKRVQEAEGELSIVKAIGNASPEMRNLKDENTALKMKLELLDNKSSK